MPIVAFLIPDNPAMHALIPFAATLDATCRQRQSELKLPQLERLLSALTPGLTDQGDEFSLTPPHERLQAQCAGLTLRDGLVPFASGAARALRAQGLLLAGTVAAREAWAFVTPCHWQLGQDHVSMSDPEALELSESHCLELLRTMQPYFAEDGIELFHLRRGTWLARSGLFSDLPCASLDRVVGRDVGDWLPRSAGASLIRRLQSEMQMLLYTSPVNAERERLGLLPVNSFWVSGCGPAPASGVEPGEQAVIDTSLRRAALHRDSHAYAEAWRALDGGLLAELNRRLQAGAPVRLSLCGERSCITLASAAGGFLSRVMRRIRPPSRQQLLDRL